MTKALFVRTSHALCFDECPFAYYLKYVLGVKQDITPANLPFGTAVHEACTGFVMANAIGDSQFKPKDVFMAHWENSLKSTPMEFSSLWGKDDLTSTGLKLVDLFPLVWKKSGLAPLIDEQGPVIERRFTVEIEPGLILSGQPDIVAMNEFGGVMPLDIKTSAQPYGEEFLIASEQLTDYQILVEENGEQLGLGDDVVENVAFLEGIKRKIPQTSKGQGPEFLEPLIGKRRSFEQVSERKQKLKWMAEDIRKGRFPKRPRMAYNTPCTVCDFSNYCLLGEKAGLVFPDKPQQIIPLTTVDSLI